MACATTTRFLQEYLGRDRVQTYKFPIRDVTQLWAVQASEAQAIEIRKEPGVSSETIHYQIF